MRHRLNNIPGTFPPAEGIPERIRVEGMQDPALVAYDDHPVWKRLEEDIGWAVIDTDNLPPLLEEADPQAVAVIQALYRLGAYD